MRDQPEEPALAGGPDPPGEPATRAPAAVAGQAGVTGRGGPGRLARLNTGGLLYGTIVSAVALAVGSTKGETGGDIVSAMTASVIIYWLAHVYTATLSGRRLGESPGLRRRLGRAIRHEAGILGGGIPALLIFIPLVLAGVALAVDVLAALGFVVAALALETYLAGRQAGVTGWRLPAEAASAVVFGALLALLMAALHV